ncbi:MAG: 50S ribosomal protein L4 [Deltaproteobacteria bacterium]|nr:50S ribosomal protein L4 [Deltaproteobacteria bacterium]
MASVDVVNQNGQKMGSIELDDSIFNAEIRDHLVQRTVVWQLAKRRQGSASTKTKGDVRGGGKKPWRQKGTGRARAGSSRSPLWKGGGTIFGPHPRSYAFSLPKKVRKAALRSVLSAKLKENQLTVLDKIELDEPKTRNFLEVCRSLGLDGHKALFVVPEKDENLSRSSRNLYHYLTLPCEGLNVYDLLRYERLVLLQDALPKIRERLA